jgi:NAD(P)-dependent dehydrogenase (short-subunit alcohol dehydrogenase family)
MKRYGISKLANVLFATEFQRRLDKESIRIISISVHPGTVGTDGGLSVFPGLLQPVARLLFSSPLQGATTGLFAATATEVAKSRDEYKGQYLVPPGKIKRASDQARDPKLAKDLWITTQHIVDDILAKIN